MKVSHKYQLAGWFLFLLCAVLYLISGIRSLDYISIAGSIIFFLACIIFLIPLIEEIGNDHRNKN
ncbi:hypothetical protein DV872_12200 [Oceanispirochaeta sp. M1]|nr:hypothetical protein DV872_12200 [Oceanispirochaeta sp. M1]